MHQEHQGKNIEVLVIQTREGQEETQGEKACCSWGLIAVGFLSHVCFIQGTKHSLPNQYNRHK